LDAKQCETTSNARDQPVPKTLVTIEVSSICPGQGLAWDFCRTEEVRSSNLLTSTLEESRSAGLFDFVGEGHIDGDADWTGFARPNRSDIFEDVTGDTG
jgi:hypothetical protein